jgi:hypothetical protein
MAEAVNSNDLSNAQAASELWSLVAAMPWGWMPAMKPADEYFRGYVHSASKTFHQVHQDKLHQRGKHQFLLCPLTVIDDHYISPHGNSGMKLLEGVCSKPLKTCDDEFIEYFVMVNRDGEITVASVVWHIEHDRDGMYRLESCTTNISKVTDAAKLSSAIYHRVKDRHCEVLDLAARNLDKPVREAQKSALRRYDATVIAGATLGQIRNKL